MAVYGGIDTSSASHVGVHSRRSAIRRSDQDTVYIHLIVDIAELARIEALFLDASTDLSYLIHRQLRELLLGCLALVHLNLQKCQIEVRRVIATGLPSPDRPIRRLRTQD